MKILFISCHTIFKVNGGRENSLNNRINSLLDEGHEIDVLYMNYADDYGVSLNKVNEFYSKKISKPVKLFNILKCFITGLPLQCALYICYQNKKYLKRILKKNEYDCIFVDMVRLAPLYKILRKKFKNKIILDLDDLISKRYLVKTDKILGQAENDNRFLSKLLKFSFIGNFALKCEAKRVRKMEIKSTDKFDIVTLISVKETNELISITNKNNILNLPMLISSHAFSNPKDHFNTDPIILGFAGLLKTPSNKESLIYILEKILPSLTINYVFKIIGKADNELISKYGNEKVVFTGFVDDFKEALRSIDLFVCPMSFGTGIKTKILEAMAAGVPVITNSVGAEGMYIVDGKEALIKESEEDIISSIIELSVDIDKLSFLSKAGNNYVANYHSKNIFIASFNKIFEYK